MKKKLLTLLALLAFCLALSGCKAPQEPAQPDFRNAFWGMSPTKVAESESIDYAYADSNLIYYLTTLEDTGEEVEITYYFTDEKLTAAELRFTQQEDRTINEIIDSYLAFREKLIGIYSEPVDPEYRVWIDKDPATEKDADNLQIYHGRMEYSTLWQTETGTIQLKFSCQGQKLAYVLLGEAAPAA